MFSRVSVILFKGVDMPGAMSLQGVGWVCQVPSRRYTLLEGTHPIEVIPLKNDPPQKVRPRPDI